MKISGFTFIRNAQILGYPLVESLLSIVPLCDEVIVAVGDSLDDTLDIINSLNEPKIRIIESVWDQNLKTGGMIYSQQTNLALSETIGDWCIYLQADEVIHENDYDLILNDINIAENSAGIDALLFKYIHFYGSYDYIGTGRQWYRREIRAFRNTGLVVSWGDAQGFRKKTKSGFSKLTAHQSEAKILHYGWVRPPKAQQKKLKLVHTYYNQDAEYKLTKVEENDFDYNSAYELLPFRGSHPLVMKSKISADMDWTMNFDASKTKKKPLIMKLADRIENVSNYRIGEFKDFIEVKK
jgi:glycosyltransferase involved in cell wall biosynthesis